jgi:hypothetical protein
MKPIVPPWICEFSQPCAFMRQTSIVRWIPFKRYLVQTLRYGPETLESKMQAAIKTHTPLNDVAEGEEFFLTYARRSNWLGRINLRQDAIFSETSDSPEAANSVHSAMVHKIAWNNSSV